ISTIEQMLLDRTIELGVVEWPVQSHLLTSQPLRRDALVLIAPPWHPLVGRGALRPSDLAGQTFILREPGSGTRMLSEQILGPVAAEITVALELDQPEAVVRVVEAGMGLAFISEAIVGSQLARGSVCALPLADTNLGHDFSLVALSDRLPTPSMQLFRAFLTHAWSAVS
ncbi:MAG TPA: LysR substrate-binding domain-containing protein, partial [Chloroflexota bacterium]|nr:LysR substrate-binding domain-containing protein [Chloroflexota bacterium]